MKPTIKELYALLDELEANKYKSLKEQKYENACRYLEEWRALSRDLKELEKSFM